MAAPVRTYPMTSGAIVFRGRQGECVKLLSTFVLQESRVKMAAVAPERTKPLHVLVPQSLTAQPVIPRLTRASPRLAFMTPSVPQQTEISHVTVPQESQEKLVTAVLMIV